MATHTQTHLGFQNPGGSTGAGSIQRANDASPSYTRNTLADDTGPNAARSFYSTGYLNRAFFELSMQALVDDGYTIGKPIIAASLTYPQVNVVGHTRVVCAPAAALGDSNADLFNAIGPASPAWSDNFLQPGSGSRVFSFNAYALHVIAGLRAGDKRIIGLCMVDESMDNNNIEGDREANYVITIETE